MSELGSVIAHNSSVLITSPRPVSAVSSPEPGPAASRPGAAGTWGVASPPDVVAGTGLLPWLSPAGDSLPSLSSQHALRCPSPAGEGGGVCSAQIAMA